MFLPDHLSHLLFTPVYLLTSLPFQLVSGARKKKKYRLPNTIALMLPAMTRQQRGGMDNDRDNDSKDGHGDNNANYNIAWTLGTTEQLRPRPQRGMMTATNLTWAAACLKWIYPWPFHCFTTENMYILCSWPYVVWGLVPITIMYYGRIGISAVTTGNSALSWLQILHWCTGVIKFCTDSTENSALMHLLSEFCTETDQNSALST